MKWFRQVLNWFRDFEPAQLKALQVSVFSILALFGVTLGTDLEATVAAVIGSAVVILTEVQALLTRFGVYSPATVGMLMAEADAPIDADLPDDELFYE